MSQFPGSLSPGAPLAKLYGSGVSGVSDQKQGHGSGCSSAQFRDCVQSFSELSQCFTDLQLETNFLRATLFDGKQSGVGQGPGPGELPAGLQPDQGLAGASQPLDTKHGQLPVAPDPGQPDAENVAPLGLPGGAQDIPGALAADDDPDVAVDMPLLAGDPAPVPVRTWVQFARESVQTAGRAVSSVGQTVVDTGVHVVSLALQHPRTVSRIVLYSLMGYGVDDIRGIGLGLSIAGGVGKLADDGVHGYRARGGTDGWAECFQGFGLGIDSAGTGLILGFKLAHAGADQHDDGLAMIMSIATLADFGLVLVTRAMASCD